MLFAQAVWMPEAQGKALRDHPVVASTPFLTGYPACAARGSCIQDASPSVAFVLWPLSSERWIVRSTVVRDLLDVVDQRIMILDDLVEGVLEGPRDELVDQAYGNQEGLRGVGMFKPRHRHLPWQSDAGTL